MHDGLALCFGPAGRENIMVGLRGGTQTFISQLGEQRGQTGAEAPLPPSKEGPQRLKASCHVLPFRSCSAS